jgi:hypothetical protein
MNLKWDEVIFMMKQGVEGHPLSLMKSSKKLMKTFMLRDVYPFMNFINIVQKCQELFSMANRAGRRSLRRWSEKTCSQAHYVHCDPW